MEEAVPTSQPSRNHPFALKVARLVAPMSLRDQKYASMMSTRIIYGTLMVSFPISYLLGNLFVAIVSVCAAGLVSAIAFGPNWLGNPDPEIAWADTNIVQAYYKQLEEMRNGKTEDSKKTE